MNRIATIILFLLFLGSCTGIKVAVCVSNPNEGGFNCKLRDGTVSFLPYAESENYVAIPPEDLEMLLAYIRHKEAACNGKALHSPKYK